MAYHKVSALRMQLPKVGDVLIRRPVTGKAIGVCSSKPRDGVVEYVNRDHFWYRVRFASGYAETYKMPVLEEQHFEYLYEED